MNKVIDGVVTPEEVVVEPVVTPVEETPEEKLEKISEERDVLLRTKETLVGELQDLRKKKQLTEEEKETLAQKVAELEGAGGEPKETDVLKKVEEMLNKSKQENVTKSQEKAMNKFIAKYPALSPANDEAGLLKSAFERKLATFNMSNLEDESEFLSVFEDTYKLLGKTDAPVIDDPAVINTPGSAAAPKAEDLNKLQPKEVEYVNKHLKGDVKRYLDLKLRYPQVVEGILK